MNDSAIPTTQLSNGVAIPVLGFGTYKVTENVEPIVASALAAGYRHIDTAQMYGNESEVGAAWQASGIAREDLFLTTKLNNPHHDPDSARLTFEQSLVELGTDYVDLFLIHWPLPELHHGDYSSVWKVMEEIYQQGKARAIGVSNFLEHHLEDLLRDSTITPHVNQIESHPYLPQDSVHRFNTAHGIVTEAWSPLARGKVVTDPTLIRIGEKHGASAAQVAIKWGLQRGDVLFPKASTPARQAENLDVFQFELDSEDMEAISLLDAGPQGRVGSHPDARK